VGADRVEGVRVPHHAAYPVESTGLQGEGHEGLIRAGERGGDAPLAGRGKPEPGIIARMANDDDNPMPEPLALFEPFFDKSAADAHALVILVHGKRSKGNRRGLSLTGNDGNRGKEDVPDDPVIVNRNKGEERIEIPVIPESVHEPGFAILCERLRLHVKNGRDISRKFRPDKIGIHPVLFAGWTDKGMYGPGCRWNEKIDNSQPPNFLARDVNETSFVSGRSK